jgi:hypothetical protein
MVPSVFQIVQSDSQIKSYDLHMLCTYLPVEINRQKWNTHPDLFQIKLTVI